MLNEYHSDEFSFTLSNWKHGSRNRFTAIIGANGTGKSRLLSDIASNFIKRNAKIAYLQDQLSATATEGQIVKKGRIYENRFPEPDKINEEQFLKPDRNNKDLPPRPKNPPVGNLLAVSNLFTDSFPFTRSLDERYKYLGHRRGLNMLTAGSLEHLMVSAILDLHKSKNILDRFNKILRNELNVASSDFIFSSKRTQNVKDALQEELERKLASGSARPKLYQLTGLEAINSVSLIESFVKEIAGWIRTLSSHGNDRPLEPESGLNILARFIDICASFNVNPSAVYNFLKRQRVLDIDLVVFRKSGVISFKDLSTGEKLLVSTIARIAANISENSVILIDEPEVGLHPNWQQKFPRLISEVVPKEYGCHFLMATHSPFVASETDDILVPDKIWGQFIQYPTSVAARSIDDILYRVFKARISGNTSVQRDVQLLLEHLSGTDSSEHSRIVKSYERLSKIADSDTTELNRILLEIKREL
ncbi:AAA family ATPase [Glutamicibacter arilaitensis]|uniref:AAA family ATPase n=1 Tax=Glutamicibacter arilaitensis TaxID=256701 RepID=UPI003A8DE9AE